MKYFFHPAAEGGYLEPIGYYELQQPGPGISCLKAFEHTMKEIIQGAGYIELKGKTRYSPEKHETVPYHIIFRETSVGIQILNVAHNHGHPNYWLKKT